MSDALWQGVDRIVGNSLSSEGLIAHGVHLLAADFWRRNDRPVPADILEEEQRVVMTLLAVPALLRRIRSLLDGPIVLLKGPEVAARYPDPSLRPYGDLDLLVRDPQSAQRTLLENGFRLSDFYEFDHQERPIYLPSLPLMIELHNSPNWLPWMTPPSVESLFEIAVPASIGIDGISTLPATEHALLMVAHSWKHNPLRSLLDLIDIAAMSEAAEPSRLETLAREWGIHRVWRMTNRAIEDVLLSPDSRLPWSVRLWAGHLTAVRDRTVIERHVLAWLSALAAPSLAKGARTVPRQIWIDVRPLRGETWSIKFARTRRAIADALQPSTPRGRSRVDD